MADTVLTPPTAGPTGRPRAWRAPSVAGVAMVLVAALVGGNFLGLRERLFGAATAPPRGPVSSRQAVGPTGGGPPTGSPDPQRTVLRSQPWWQEITTVRGTGSMTASPFTVDSGAIQWRLTPTCQTGHVRVQTPAKPKPVLDASCPSTAVGYENQTGSVSLVVAADGPWELKVEQQIDVPLDEAPLPSMTDPGAATVSRGEFYRIDQVGQGEVRIYRLADGTFALRLEDFFVSPNVDLEVKLSPLEAPHSTDQFTASPSALVASLDVTAGSLNFSVPPGVNPLDFKSVVIWCDLVHSAYAAASLGPP